jgi:outer membrane protein OmpA-like peptidoglycan-associated protein
MLTAKGYGPKFPIDTNKTAEGRANNRRVVLKQLP